jgi:hypothetical protein
MAVRTKRDRAVGVEAAGAKEGKKDQPPVERRVLRWRWDFLRR